MPQVSFDLQRFYPQFRRDNIGDHLVDAGFTCPEGYYVKLTSYGSSIVIREHGAADMFSHPYVGFAADEEVEETQAFRDFIDRLFHLKATASPRLRWYVLQLIYDDRFRQRFLQHPEEELAVAPLKDEDKKTLLKAVEWLQAEVEAFKPGKIVDDGDHFLLFPQTVEKVAPRAWFDAAWSYITHFRSNFGFYLGEALLYSRVTILGSVTSNPAVTEQQEAFLKRDASRLVERIAITNADDLRQVLSWGAAHKVRFGLGEEIAEMILASKPEEEIIATIQARLEPAMME